MQHSIISFVTKEIVEELSKLYQDPAPFIEKWNLTQVREPYDAGEVEDLFFGLEDGYR